MQVLHNNNTTPDWAKQGSAAPATASPSSPDWARQQNMVAQAQIPVAEKSAAQKSEKKSVTGRFGQKLPIVVIMILTVAVVLVLFGFTCFGFANNTETDAGANLNNDCSFKGYRPTRLRSKFDTEYLMCGWKSSRQAHRFVVCIVAALSPILFFIADRRKWRPAVFVYATWAGVLGALFFWAMCNDATDVHNNLNFCNDLEDLSGNPVVCGFWPFIVTCLFDALAFVVQAIQGLIVARYAWKSM
eukprot:TRINITY_DN1785_c0_g1_i1.p1 TRINITY_DN1785_c0_g1~~TRINITY_DN1785_c0_g1_i1.p1  ORF type:complete len:244 (+),score=25.79 TRINITY_DN1785_c0_g1_i1:230-961(+)